MLIFIFQLVKMENPFKEPQKGCTLCKVTVDYKNIQVSQTHLHGLLENLENG